MKDLQNKIEQAAAALKKECLGNGNDLDVCIYGTIQFKAGANFLINEGYVFTKEDMIEFMQGLMDYTSQSCNILGHDEREAKEFVEIFLKQKQL